MPDSTTSTTSNKLEEFINKAMSYIGTTGSQWASSHGKWYYTGAWCAGFVSACGEEVGILGQVFDGSLSAYSCAHSVRKYGGSIHYEKSYNPQRGDLVNFMWGGGSVSGEYADHIGIVTRFDGSTVYTVEGNTSNAVHERQYSRSSSSLAAFCTPDWSRVGGFAAGGGGLSITGSLFQEENTRKDAILREAAYLETIYEDKRQTKIKSYEPSEIEQPIRLSIVNYTELFQTFWNVGSSSIGINKNDGSYDYSKLEPKVREVIEHLVSKGLNNAGACGIAGNIKYESNFNTATVGDGGTSFGICQWHNERGSAMKRFVGSNWSTNLTGQLNYLWHELESSYSSVLNYIKTVPNTEQGARSAADRFVRDFEIPANVNYQSSLRQNQAAEYFNQIVQVIVNSGNSNFNSVDLNNVSEVRRARVQRANSCIGKPYVWGGVGPDGYDCSGLVSYAVLGEHRRLGTTQTFMGYPTATNPQPGDICTTSSHCGLYIGDGKMIHAPHSGATVTTANVQSGMKYVTYG